MKVLQLPEPSIAADFGKAANLHPRSQKFTVTLSSLRVPAPENDYTCSSEKSEPAIELTRQTPCRLSRMSGIR
jgi:hypothetical protein